jgi:hypothetical protein
MTSELRYYIRVKRSIPATVALFSLVALLLILAASSSAQINGTPSSVTSPGFGGRAINGPPASVTSLGPRGYAPRGATFSTFGPGDGQHHHHHYVDYAPTIVYAVPVPYAADNVAQDENADADAPENDPEYRGGPTVFDRRGSGAESYMPPMRDVPSSRSIQRAEAEPPVEEPPLEPTTLIFKDGHKQDVANYAIIGTTLFDLTPGHHHKILVADLDLDATRKLNDEHGVTFRLPKSN